MKYTDLAKLLTNKNLDDVFRWQCPYQMILEDEQDFCADCDMACDECWNQEKISRGKDGRQENLSKGLVASGGI